jgi:hypothetical protein
LYFIKFSIVHDFVLGEPTRARCEQRRHIHFARMVMFFMGFGRRGGEPSSSTHFPVSLSSNLVDHRLPLVNESFVYLGSSGTVNEYLQFGCRASNGYLYAGSLRTLILLKPSFFPKYVHSCGYPRFWSSPVVLELRQIKYLSFRNIIPFFDNASHFSRLFLVMNQFMG